QLVSRIRHAFGKDIPLRLVFDSPTVACLAQALSSAMESASPAASQPILPAGRDSRLPLSFAQQRLWFLDQLVPGSPFYNVPAAIRLRGELDIEALRRTVSEVVRRHEVLRTRFEVVGSEPVQVIEEAVDVELPVIDLSELSEGEREEEARRVASEEGRKPFELSKGPMLRVRVLRLGEREHVVTLTMHHIVSDGWSMGVLVKEVGQLYGRYAGGEEVELAEIGLQYADYAVWQREVMSVEVMEEEERYWREQLGGELPVMELGRRGRERKGRGQRGGRKAEVIGKELSEGVKRLSRGEGVTLFMMLVGAFKVLLHKYTSLDDIIVGTPIAGRDRKEVEGLIGFFVNTLALRTSLKGNPTYRELLGRVREVALGAYAHQNLPFEKLIEILKPERQLSRTPVFQVVFALQNAPSHRLELPGLTLSEMALDDKTSHFDLTLLAMDTEEGLMVSMEYDADLFEAPAISRMLKHYQTLLTSIVANPDARLDELEITSEAEKTEQSLERARRRESSIKKLRTVKRTAVDLPQAALAERPALDIKRLSD
ncbi:MAG TPA: condensation domain-containing protein, partial [Rubrobacter sp.]|nr:condensation domain-containing protein [Rubrobacter sp.]